MSGEPELKRAMVFVDGQNLFHAAKEAFGYREPNFDVRRLAELVCAANQWDLRGVRFYTGLPDDQANPRWHGYWSRKLAQMGRQDVVVFTRPLRYRIRSIQLSDGRVERGPVGVEKGIDVRIALDIVGAAIANEYDVAVVFSQDQDLSEVAEEIRSIARVTKRWIRIASAYPCSPASQNRRGINKTDWIKIDREDYDECLDGTDYHHAD